MCLLAYDGRIYLPILAAMHGSYYKRARQPCTTRVRSAGAFGCHQVHQCPLHACKRDKLSTACGINCARQATTACRWLQLLRLNRCMGLGALPSA